MYARKPQVLLLIALATRLCEKCNPRNYYCFNVLLKTTDKLGKVVYNDDQDARENNKKLKSNNSMKSIAFYSLLNIIKEEEEVKLNL